MLLSFSVNPSSTPGPLSVPSLIDTFMYLEFSYTATLKC